MIVFVILMFSVDCERGFFVFKRIKIRLRNRFSNRILNNFLIIFIEGLELEEFDFEKVADIWGV